MGRRVTIEAAAALAGVSRRTIYNWLRAGRLTYVRTAGGNVRIDSDSLFRAPDRAEPVQPLAPFPQGPLIHPADRERFLRSRP